LKREVTIDVFMSKTYMLDEEDIPEFFESITEELANNPSAFVNECDTFSMDQNIT
jgi:hypothetical protein